MDVAISGSSGLIGTALRPALEAAGHRPIALVRRAVRPGADEIRWQPLASEVDAKALDGVDAIVNLAGAGISDKRWTPKYKELLVTSRTTATELLVKTMSELAQPPSCFLSGSAIGIYGDRGDETLTESSQRGAGFLADLVEKWEAAAAPAAEAGVRTAMLRTGIVLTAEGGALAKMLPLFKMGMGGRFGRGNQYQSWISLDDEVAAIVHLLSAKVSGPVNLTAPHPVTNNEFTRALGTVLSRPTFLPVPAFGPKLLFGSEMAQALVFESQRILPEALLGSGYEFKQPDIESGLRAALKKG